MANNFSSSSEPFIAETSFVRTHSILTPMILRSSSTYYYQCYVMLIRTLWLVARHILNEYSECSGGKNVMKCNVSE